jgi:hypothetical protein
MSVASGDQPGVTESRHSGPAACYYKCIVCSQRFWQKKALVRRAAKCRGARFNPDGTRWACKAWRCRYNDQCPGANTACPICGAYKPPESMPTKPVPGSSPAFVSRSASSVDPSPVPTDQDPAVSRAGPLSRSIYGHPGGSSQWEKYVENRSRPSDMRSRVTFVDDQVISDQQGDVPAGTITHLPLYGNVTARYLTEV